MPKKKTVFAVLAGFVWLAVSRYLIHNVWLANAYTNNPLLWRSQSAMLHRLWVIHLANFILAVAATLIYVRGIESKPWPGQGLRFGILLALATAVPQSLVEYFVYPISHTLALQWIIGEGALMVLLGLLIAAICRPSAA
ncbi:MAG TPA: hypothetical protein VKE93_06290 [Candidatus Angelobacter sp.]|nr:hypothetical protein [Candidatus Angelobacter sp.]